MNEWMILALAFFLPFRAFLLIVLFVSFAIPVRVPTLKLIALHGRSPDQSCTMFECIVCILRNNRLTVVQSIALFYLSKASRAFDAYNHCIKIDHIPSSFCRRNESWENKTHYQPAAAQTAEHSEKMESLRSGGFLRFPRTLTQQNASQGQQ